MKQMWDQKDLIKLIQEYSTGGTYTAGTGINISDQNVISNVIELESIEGTPYAISLNWIPDILVGKTAAKAQNLIGGGTNKVPVSNGFSASKWVAPTAGYDNILVYNGNDAETRFEIADNVSVGNAINAGYAQECGRAMEVNVMTIEPIADNESGNYIIVQLSSAPATYYNGYIYLIKASV